MKALKTRRHAAYGVGASAWWKAASLRAVRTAISVFLPFLAAGTFLEVDYKLAASTIGLAVIVSYLTSLAGLKELTGTNAPKSLAVAVRAVKQFAQTLVSYIGVAVVLTEVDWNAALALSTTAAFVTILTGALTHLPEEESVGVENTN